MTETYLPVRTMIIKVSTDAVLIHQQAIYSHWIPLSLIHGADELKLRKAMRGDVITLRIMDWKVRALDLPVETRR